MCIFCAGEWSLVRSCVPRRFSLWSGALHQGLPRFNGNAVLCNRPFHAAAQ